MMQSGGMKKLEELINEYCRNEYLSKLKTRRKYNIQNFIDQSAINRHKSEYIK